MQGTRDVEGLVFTMVSDLGKLKRKVDLLGSPKDTLSHRCACTDSSCRCLYAETAAHTLGAGINLQTDMHAWPSWASWQQLCRVSHALSQQAYCAVLAALWPRCFHE